MDKEKEKVIKGLKYLHDCEAWQEGVPPLFNRAEDRRKITQAAIELLKEQEPILLENQHKPYGISTNANSPWISRCPRCGKKVEGKQTRFCKYCGQRVKWE